MVGSLGQPFCPVGELLPIAHTEVCQDAVDGIDYPLVLDHT